MQIQITEDRSPTNIFVRRDPLARAQRLKHLLKHVASKHGASVDELCGPSRQINLVKARGEFWYHALREFGCSAQWMAEYLNRKCHDTVRIGIAMHCVRNGLPFPEGYNWQFWLRRRETQRIRVKR